MKKAVLKNFSSTHRKVAGLQLYCKETPTQMPSSEYCKIFKSTYFEEHLRKLSTIPSKFKNLCFISKRLIHVT